MTRCRSWTQCYAKDMLGDLDVGHVCWNRGHRIICQLEKNHEGRHRADPACGGRLFWTVDCDFDP